MVDGQAGKGDEPRPRNKNNFNDGWDKAFGPTRGEEMDQQEKIDPGYMVKMVDPESFTQIDIRFNVPYSRIVGVSLSPDFLMKITGRICDLIFKEIVDDRDDVLRPPYEAFTSSIVGPGWIEYKFSGSEAPEEKLIKVVKNVLSKFNNNLPSVEEIMES